MREMTATAINSWHKPLLQSPKHAEIGSRPSRAVNQDRNLGLKADLRDEGKHLSQSARFPKPDIASGLKKQDALDVLHQTLRGCCTSLCACVGRVPELAFLAKKVVRAAHFGGHVGQ